MQDDLEKLGLKDVSGQYVISNNGAVIVENKNNRIVKTETMKFETVNELFKLGIEHPRVLRSYLYARRVIHLEYER